MQWIHLDICAIPSHDPRPLMLRNLYGIDLGTSGLILQAQSREEILADKVIALAFRENRIKNRDLWDIGWLKQQNIDVPMSMIVSKIRDHGRSKDEFLSALDEFHDLRQRRGVGRMEDASRERPRTVQRARVNLAAT